MVKSSFIDRIHRNLSYWVDVADDIEIGKFSWFTSELDNLQNAVKFGLPLPETRRSPR